MPELPPANWGEGFSASGVVLNIYNMKKTTVYLVNRKWVEVPYFSNNLREKFLKKQECVVLCFLSVAKVFIFN